MQTERTTSTTGKRIRILVVDDDPQVLASLRRTLKFEYDGEYASSAEQAIQILQRDQSFALILTDMRMPGLNGVDLLVESLKYVPNAARIVISGYTDYDTVIEAINRGHAHRFMSKPFEPDQLMQALNESLLAYHLEQERDLLLAELQASNARLRAHELELDRLVQARTQELEEANRRLQELAVRDPLTGIFNQRYLYDRLTIEIARARRHGHALGVLMIDIDKLKTVNDQFGHSVGDEVLRNIANVLVHGAKVPEGLVRGRISDVVARFGGEEFVLILPETPREGAHVKAERVRGAIELQRFQIAGVIDSIAVTVSVGVASYPNDGEDGRALLQAADLALQKAKQDGRNRVCGT